MVWVSGMRSGGRPQDHHFLILFFINFFQFFVFFSIISLFYLFINFFQFFLQLQFLFPFFKFWFCFFNFFVSGCPQDRHFYMFGHFLIKICVSCSFPTKKWSHELQVFWHIFQTEIGNSPLCDIRELHIELFRTKLDFYWKTNIMSFIAKELQEISKNLQWGLSGLSHDILPPYRWVFRKYWLSFKEISVLKK